MDNARVLLVILVTLVAVPSPSAGQGVLPPEAEAARKYILERDYPEVFGGKHYPPRIQNIIVADLANDGHKEVVVHYAPHYRQSATVVIYRVDERMKVTRIM